MRRVVAIVLPIVLPTTAAFYTAPCSNGFTARSGRASLPLVSMNIFPDAMPGLFPSDGIEAGDQNDADLYMDRSRVAARMQHAPQERAKVGANREARRAIKKRKKKKKK